jgi:hypothetical protein
MNNNNKSTRGGKRPNAGAPKKSDTAKARSIRLNEADWDAFQKLGGVEWLRLYLKQFKN